MNTTKCEFALFYRRDVANRYYEFPFCSAFILSMDTSCAYVYMKCCYFKVKALQWNSSAIYVRSYKYNSLVFYEQKKNENSFTVVYFRINSHDQKRTQLQQEINT